MPCSTSFDHAMFGAACLPFYGSGSQTRNDDKPLLRTPDSKGEYRDGKQVGFWQYWYANSQLKRKANTEMVSGLAPLA